jgi:hypothetical protein
VRNATQNPAPSRPAQGKPVNTSAIVDALSGLATELIQGTPESPGYVLNRGDAGLLDSLDRLTSSAASATHQGGASIAAHARHIAYALSLLNRWAAGDDSWRDADWAAAWKETSVDDGQWAELRRQLRRECVEWQKNLRLPRDVDDVELRGLIASNAHIAYHFGGIRQIDRATRGPASPA